jgi:uncharacterized SAM-binding protein YcdF (DUF218 family)
LIRNLGRLGLASVAAAVLLGGYTALRVWDQGGRDERRPADAIVVLGAAQYDGRPSPVFRARLEHAVALYEAGLAPYLVVTGGKAAGDRTTEAEAARRFALRRGVPAEAILVENESRTTYESMRAVSALLREHDLASAVFVSDRTHMLRVLRMAGDQDIVAWGSPTATSPIDADPGRRMRATLREVVALGVYFVAGRAAPPDPVLTGAD